MGDPATPASWAIRRATGDSLAQQHVRRRSRRLTLGRRQEPRTYQPASRPQRPSASRGGECDAPRKARSGVCLWSSRTSRPRRYSRSKSTSDRRVIGIENHSSVASAVQDRSRVASWRDAAGSRSHKEHGPAGDESSAGVCASHLQSVHVQPGSRARRLRLARQSMSLACFKPSQGRCCREPGTDRLAATVRRCSGRPATTRCRR